MGRRYNPDTAGWDTTPSGSPGEGHNIVAFTGTNTGSVYAVGQLYRNGNGTFRANGDGSFTNVATGAILEGSSHSPSAQFFAAETTRSGPGRAAASSGSGPVATAGPGNAGAATGAGAVTPPVQAGGGPGNPVAVTQQPNRKKALRAGAFLTQQIGSFSLVTDQSFPNVEDFWEPRYGEVGEVLGGVINVIADVHATDTAGDLDRQVGGYIRDSVNVSPGSVADHVIRFGDNLFNGPATSSDVTPITTNNPMWPANRPQVGGGF